MPKLAFHGQGKYTDFEDSYEKYASRSKSGKYMTESEYRRAVKLYCKILSDRLEKQGMVDLPNDIGSIIAAQIPRAVQYRGKKYVGFGKIDWDRGVRDGSTTAFGIVFLPKRLKKKNENLRCYGFVANRRLFQRMKKSYDNGSNDWEPMWFSKEMI